MSESGTKSLEVTCPCCRTELTLDRASGEILHQKRSTKKGLSWEEALTAGQKKASAAEKAFERNMARERDGDSLLDRKFEEALRKADKSDDPPPRIFDLD